MGMNKDLKKAIDEVFEELKALSPEEFKKLLDEHADGEIAKLLQAAWQDPDSTS